MEESKDAGQVQQATTDETTDTEELYQKIARLLVAETLASILNTVDEKKRAIKLNEQRQDQIVKLNEEKQKKLDEEERLSAKLVVPQHNDKTIKKSKLHKPRSASELAAPIDINENTERE